jgi:glycosyltransferase involved in cell wall biosynthesis
VEDAAALHGALQRLLDDASLRGRIGETASERARAAYGIDSVVDRIDAVYRKLL